ncbi:MAG: hypothetical protein ABJQ71_18845 [Roseibium sp.]
MSAIFVIHKVTKSPCSPTIRTNPDETDNASYTSGDSAIIVNQTKRPSRKGSLTNQESDWSHEIERFVALPVILHGSGLVGHIVAWVQRSDGH